MKFHEYKCLYHCVDHGQESSDEWYHRLYAENNERRDEVACYFAELGWLQQRRPYYSVWPSVAIPLAKVTLDVDCSLVNPPIECLLVRLAVGHEIPIGGRRLQSVLACWKYIQGQYCMWFLMDFGDSGNNGVPQPTRAGITLVKGTTIEHQLSLSPNISILRPIELQRDVQLGMKLCVAVSLIARDSELIEPDVLDADRCRYEETRDKSLIDRATRRGKIGWHIGRNIEVSPHYRRPHFGIRWTGQGRAVPQVVPVKGCIVKRRELTEVPTGYLDDDETKCRSEMTT